MRSIETPAALLLLFSLFHQVSCWYLPGSAPTSYTSGDSVPLLVNSLSPLSDSQETNALISYDYYHPKLHFCQPEGGPQAQPESLGSILSGDRLYNSPLKLNMLQPANCEVLCKTTVPAADANFIENRIRHHYAVNWLVDGLPAAKAKVTQDQTVFYSVGFDLGQFADGGDPSDVALNNHYDILIDYHERASDDIRVVGVLVWPSSRATNGAGDCSTPEAPPLRLSTQQSTEVTYTYSVTWRKSDTAWATRWDPYLQVVNAKIHWFSLINSTIVCLFLCAMVLAVLNKAVYKDTDRYNALDLSEDVQEDFGWKLVSGEVFRPPQKPLLLSVVVGTGSQLAGMMLVTLLFAMFGFLSPSNRGSLTSALFAFLLLFSSLAGYVGTRVYLTCEGDAWITNALATATIFPGALFSVLLFLNLFLIASGGAGAVPFGTLLAIVLLWFAISLPLALGGAYLAQKHGGLSHPARVNAIPRQIPPTPKILKTWPAALFGGVFSFGAGFIELFWILASLFGSKVYYAFGFLGVVYIVTCVTASTIAILLAYFRLCSENYRWQWQSILFAGAGSIYIVLYGLGFWATRLQLHGIASKMLYLGNLLVLASVNFLITGSIGFIATYLFLRRIYARVRLD